MSSLTVSVVSHRQNALTNALLGDLSRLSQGGISLVVTENIPDIVALELPEGLRADRIANERPKGFGANHNAAFTHCRTPYFCICNPDIRLPRNPFPALLEAFGNPEAGAVGPLVRDPEGRTEDSARRFPTAWSLLKKLFVSPRGPDYPTDAGMIEVDWVAGMFMLFRREAFEAVNGFDEAYFLYYEDVDICRRLRRAGKKTVLNPAAEVTHDARRTSRRDLRYGMHHVSSALRFLGRQASGR